MTTETNTTENRNGSITAGLTTGIIGTSLGALGLLGGGASLLSLNKDSEYARKDNVESGLQLTAKDSEIALLKAEMRADEKLNAAIERINHRIDFNKHEQDGVNAMQLSYNAGNTATIGFLQNQVGQLYSMTQLGVKNSALTPGVPPVMLSFPPAAYTTVQSTASSTTSADTAG